MKQLFSKEQYDKATWKELLPLECIKCLKTFYEPKSILSLIIKNTNKRLKKDWCQECYLTVFNPKIITNCVQCNKILHKLHSEVKRTKNNFCSRSCAATYNNAHRKTGTRRSKLEIWLEDKLKSTFPNLTFSFNDKTVINSELDIYIQSLNLAFELNGIFHYEPIYGENKLSQIQNNDTRKFQACLEKQIELCIIDTSKLKYMKEKNALLYLEIISNIIKSKWQMNESNVLT